MGEFMLDRDTAKVSTIVTRRCVNMLLGIGLAALCLFASVSGSAWAAGADQLRTKRLSLVVVRQELPQVMQAIGEIMGVRVDLGRNLRGTIDNMTLDGTASEALDKVFASVGAVWWFDGTTIFAVRQDDIASRTMPSDMPPEALISAGRRLGLPMHLAAVKRDPRSGTVQVSAPTPVMSEIEKVAKRLGERYGKVRLYEYGKTVVRKAETY
jgi:hypothetical protein